VRTIYQGIDHGRFYPRDRVEARRKLRIPQGVTVFVWVGRLIGLKRLDLLVEAVSLLHRGGRRVKLYLLGDGPKRGSVSAYAESLGLGSVVDFVGPVSQEQLPEWYSAADATVLCSDSEGLPNVLRESLACGTPFVATNVGSISEFAPPDCSQLTHPGDAAGLAEGMATILQPGFRIAAGLYRSRTWKECAHETAELLATLVRNRAIRSDAAAVEPRLDLETLLAQSGSVDTPSAPLVRRPAAEPTIPASQSSAPADDFMAQLNRSLFPGPRLQREVSR
jgi:glycosyltransferase involved in cell wall biosynthesis